MERKPVKTYYYKDLLNDDFFETLTIKKKPVTSEYKYVNTSKTYRFWQFIITYFVAVPLLSTIMRLKHGVKVKNRKILKQVKGQAFFLYGNHTQNLDSALPQSILLPTRKVHMLSHPAATSIKGLRTVVGMLGALPLPESSTNFRASVNFLKAMDFYVKKKRVIAIYPEAHIWPYYTDIRPFGDLSFMYPVQANAPVVAFVTTYQKRFLRKAPRMVVTLSEVFYPNPNLEKFAARSELRDKVYNFMIAHAHQPNNYVYYEYKHISEKPTEEHEEKAAKQA